MRRTEWLIPAIRRRGGVQANDERREERKMKLVVVKSGPQNTAVQNRGIIYTVTCTFKNYQGDSLRGSQTLTQINKWPFVCSYNLTPSVSSAVIIPIINQP